jgi:2-oxoglutarate ferredoxin oxidoreductase subunit beta
MLRQKSELRPSAYNDTVDTPFRPNTLPTGVLARSERPEYGAAYRAYADKVKAAGKAKRG